MTESLRAGCDCLLLLRWLGCSAGGGSLSLLCRARSAEPLGELVLVHLPRRQSESCPCGILLRSVEAESVQLQEHTCNGESDSLVAVSKRMVLSDGICICGREAKEVGLF